MDQPVDLSEKTLPVRSGVGMLIPFVAAALAALFMFFTGLNALGILLLITLGVLLTGFVVIGPNEAAVVTFFGTYLGTVRDGGLEWTRLFTARTRVSLRSRTFETERLKVNDRSGNPIEIGAVVVWRVRDTAKALFAVDDYAAFVPIQAETALRSLAAAYPYEPTETSPLSLRDDQEEVSAALAEHLTRSLAEAGVEVVEARLTHLAYAPEIAAAMLQRQQAEAVIGARAKIVEGAVHIASSALDQLEAEAGKIPAERRAEIVGNLLIVLCGERGVHPMMDVSHRGR